MTPVRLIGVDWSTSESKRGIAVFDYSDGLVALVELAACSSRRAALHVISAAVLESSSAIVIAIDAPLGLPVGMSAALTDHSAGDGLNVAPNEMFSRETDRFVRHKLKKTPLEVGANLIARTAHSANQFLRDMRETTSRDIPLLWSPEQLRGTGVIEVYPAATRIAMTPETAAGLLGIDDSEIVSADSHVADAVWCAATALRFVRGECHPPTDPATSRREGWIWFPQSRVTPSVEIFPR